MPVGELYALLTLNAAQFETGLAEAGAQARTFGSGAVSAFASVAKKVAEAGVAVGLVAVGIGVEGLRLSDSLVKAQALIAQAYGKTSAALDKWTADNAVALGVTETDLDKSLSTWGVYAKGVGLTTGQAASSGEDLAKRAAQIAAVTGQSFDDVFTALEKGVQGATRGLKTYGVAIDANSLKQEAMKLGLYSGTGALDLHAKAVATEALIMQQTTPYVAAFGTAQQTAGFQVQDIGVVIDQTMTSIGAAVTPIAAEVMPLFANAVKEASAWVVANLPTIMGIAKTVMGAIGQAVGLAGQAVSWFVTNILPGLITTFQTIVQKVLPPLQDAFNTLVTVVLPALGKAFGYVTDTVLPPVQDAIAWITSNGQDLTPILAALGAIVLAAVVPPFVLWAAATITALAPIIAIGAAVAVFVAILDKLGLLKPIIAAIMDFFQKEFAGAQVLVKILVDGLSAFIGFLQDTVLPVVQTVVGAIGSVFSGIATTVGKVFGSIAGIVKGVFNTIIGLVDAVIGAIDAVQFHVSIANPLGGNINFGWDGLNLPKIPFLAAGTPSFLGGWAVLGEQGPELARLPGGTQVYPAGQSAAMMAGGQGRQGPVVGTQNIYGVQPDDVERQTRRAIRRAALEFQLAGGHA